MTAIVALTPFDELVPAQFPIRGNRALATAPQNDDMFDLLAAHLHGRIDDLLELDLRAFSISDVRG